MSLDQELRAVLGDRAEAGRAPLPDIDALKARGLMRRRRRRLLLALPAVVAVAVVAVGLAWSQGHLDRATEPGPVGQPVSSYVGRWTSTDADGSFQTMTISPRSDGEYEMVLRDDLTGVCSGPSTDTGTGTVLSRRLVITGITTDCENSRKGDGGSGTLTFDHHPVSDKLTDNAGVLWSRAFGKQSQLRAARQLVDSFVGRWTSTDLDGSSQTMTIRERPDVPFEMVLRDDFSGPCSGPSTDTGAGAIAASELVISGIVTVCRDGGVPVGAVNSLTFHPTDSDALRDNSGVVWSRE
ncbi:MAG TPA: hypothetical protein VHR35_05535 [Nocardioides sp.]|jgi:hypothetical protein|nr:hypothetical protein [Nocardioides sp.]